MTENRTCCKLEHLASDRTARNRECKVCHEPMGKSRTPERGSVYDRWCSGYHIGLLMERLQVRRLAISLMCNDFGQVDHTTYMSFYQHYKLILTKKRLSSAAEKTASHLSENNVSVPLGLQLFILRADCLVTAVEYTRL